MAQPKRLSGISYDHLAAYFVTTVTLNRVKAFDANDFGRFVISATALQEGADFKAMVKAWKQATGFEWSQRHGRRLWQKGYWERVLRDNEASLSVCRYILENPVRAKLVALPSEYPLCGYAVHHSRHSRGSANQGVVESVLRAN